MPKPESGCLPARDALDTIAARWLARRDAGLSAAEERELEAWLAADSRHAAAWADLETTWRAFDQPRRSGVANVMMLELAARQSRRRWRVYGGFAASIAVAAGIAFLLVAGPAARVTDGPAVATGILSKPERRLLVDGSVIELNAGAEVVVRYGATRREVRLVRGEAHFAVAKDSARPFVVKAGAVEVRAVGTAFVVKLDPQAVDVLVTEGRVAIDRAAAAEAAAPAAIEVAAGARLSVPVASMPGDALRTEPVAGEEIARRLAWRGPRLELSGTPLAEAVALLNRKNALQIVIRDASLGEMRLSGVFRADNAEGFVRLLESHYGVRVERRGTNELVLRKTP